MLTLVWRWLLLTSSWWSPISGSLHWSTMQSYQGVWYWRACFRSNQAGRSDPAHATSDPAVSRQGIYISVWKVIFFFLSLKPKMSKGNKELTLHPVEEHHERMWTRLHVLSPKETERSISNKSNSIKRKQGTPRTTQSFVLGSYRSQLTKWYSSVQKHRNEWTWEIKFHHAP